MLQIAVVEDEAGVRETLTAYIRQYGEENALAIEVTAYEDGAVLAEGYAPGYDIIFLDIEMPGLDGMQTARRIRAVDADVVLVFVTNMAQYAIHGYEVGALDFVLKPVNYYTFAVRLERAIGRVRKREAGQVILNLPDGTVKLDTRQIYYVDIQNRMLHYHTELGEFVLRGTLQGAQDALEKYHFVRCNHWYLVNLRHVRQVKKDVVVVAGNELEISRRNKAAFTAALTAFVGEGL